MFLLGPWCSDGCGNSYSLSYLLTPWRFPYLHSTLFPPKQWSAKSHIATIYIHFIPCFSLDTMSDFFRKSWYFKTSSIFVCLHNLYRFLWIIQLCSGGPWTKISAICEYKASDNRRYLLPIAEIADTTKSAYLEPQTCATNLKKHTSTIQNGNNLKIPFSCLKGKDRITPKNRYNFHQSMFF